MRKINGSIVFAILVMLLLAPLAYCAGISVHIDGYYGGSLDVNADYQITGTDPTGLESFVSGMVTYGYNNFSIYPSISFTGQLHEEINEGADGLTWTISGSLLLAAGESSLNLEVNAQYIEDKDGAYFTPDSYYKINGTTFPFNEDVWDILDSLTWCGLLVD